MLHPRGETVRWTKDIFITFHLQSRERFVAQFSDDRVSSQHIHSPHRSKVSALLVGLIHFVSEGSQTHSHKLQRWCSRREWRGSRWGWSLCRNRWRLRSCREGDRVMNVNHKARGKQRGLSSVRGSAPYLHVRLMTSMTPSYLLCWSCRRARTTWYGYVVATANIFDKAAMVMYSNAFC